MRSLRGSRPLVLLLVLAFLAPLAGLAGDCDDCGDLFGGSPLGCCPSACSACACCGQGPTVPVAAPSVQRLPVAVSIAGTAVRGGLLAPDPRDVFHVPKSLPS